MPGSGCQGPWGYLCASVVLFVRIWEVFVTLGVDKSRSCVYAGKDNKTLKGLIEHRALGNGEL
jgi:hypothetical protein